MMKTNPLYNRKIKNGTDLNTIKGLSKSWKVGKSHCGVYTGGKVECSKDGKIIACILHDDVAILDASNGVLLKTLQENIEEEVKESIVSFCIRPHQQQIITASRNLLIRIWDIETLKCLRTIKAHETPVLDMTCDPTGTLMATGGSDRMVKVFDIEKGFCTHNFKGHNGIITKVIFHPDDKRLQLISCSDDTSVRIWDLYGQKCVAHLTDHMSHVTAVDFSCDGWTLITSGRDKIINFWDLRRYELLYTYPIYEVIEGLCVIPNEQCDAIDEIDSSKLNKSMTHFITVGEKGIIRLWQSERQQNKKIICHSILKRERESSSLQYIGALYNSFRNQVIVITAEHNLMLLEKNLSCHSQIIGYNDDILDIKYIPNAKDLNQPSSELVVATNSEQIRIMNRETLSCDLLNGHQDIVMAIDVSPDGQWLISVSKDKTCRLWNLLTKTCVGEGLGHVEAIGCVAMSRKVSQYEIGKAFFITGSADKTMKLWFLLNVNKKTIKSNLQQMTASMGIKAHDKDINTIAISPNDRIVATGSQDKLIKLWNTNDLSLLGTCNGHKRGVWSVSFSSIDQCFVSGSADKTVRIWSVKDFSCLKTFEGHTASVLNVGFISCGMQIVSSGADGLIKLWTIKTNECENTFDQHEDKIWALAIAMDEKEIISGGADSMINFWKDTTQEEEFALVADREEIVLKEQALMNCMHQQDFFQAAKLAFELGHPNRLKKVFMSLLDGPNNMNENPYQDQSNDKHYSSPLDSILSQLNNSQLNDLLTWTRDWNTNAKTSHLAQIILSSLLQSLTIEQWKELDQIENKLQGLLAYSQRHFQRWEKLFTKSYLVDYTLISMKKILPTMEKKRNLITQEDDDIQLPEQKKSKSIE